MKRRLLVAGTLAVLVVVGVASTSGFACVRAAKTRVAIRDNGTEGVPDGRFTLALSGVLYDAGKDLITPLGGNAVIRKIFDRMVSDLVENTSKQVREAGVKTLADLRRFPKRLAAFSDEIETERAQTKSFLYENLYFSKALEPEKDASERVITELFEHWIAAPDALPASHREKAQREPLPRVVCDYIAGMTDNFILDQHGKMVARS